MMGKSVARGKRRFLRGIATNTSTSFGIHERSRLSCIMSNIATAIEPEMAALLEAGRALNTRWIPCPKMRVMMPFHVHCHNPYL